MTPKQAIKHYKTQVALAEAAGVTQPCVSNWLKRGRVSPLAQLKLQTLTDGVLKADRSVNRRVSQA